MGISGGNGLTGRAPRRRWLVASAAALAVLAGSPGSGASGLEAPASRAVELRIDPAFAEHRRLERASAPAPPQPPPVEVWPEQEPGWEQRKGEAALGRIDFPWQELGFEIRFLPARAGYKAGMFPYENVIEVWVRTETTVSELAFDIAHELGHALDWTRGNTATRQAFREIRGYAANPAWFTCSGCTDLSTPAGDFAETFAYATVGPVTFRSQLAPPPSPEQLASLAPLFSV